MSVSDTSDIFYVGNTTSGDFGVKANGSIYSTASPANAANVLFPGTLALGTAGYSSGAGLQVTGTQVLRYRIPAASAVVASTTGVHAAITDTGALQTITTGITNPAVPRNLTVTAGGTAGDIKAISVTITGTNMNDEVISEAIGPFTVDTAGTITGSKIFKTVTSISLPAHDNTGATTAVGFGNKFGLPAKLTANTVLSAALAGNKETTAPTVTFDDDELEKNGFTLNSTPNSSQIDVWFMPQ